MSRSNISRFTEHYTDIEDVTIFNLNKYKSKEPNNTFDEIRYNEFMKFYNKTNSLLDREIYRNWGDSIRAFPFKEEFKGIIEGIKKDYYDIYLKPIETENRYPYFLKDLYNKSYKAYEKYEEILNLSKDKYGKPIRIENQTDTQIFDTLKLRINGLQKCQTYKPKTITNENEMEYYKIEYDRELTKYNELSSNIDISMSKKVEEQCRNIFYNLDALNKYKDNEYNFAAIESFFSDKTEELYSRTFLPKDCFDLDLITNKYKLNLIKLEELLKSGDRNYRQFIFGFYSENILKTIRDNIKPFLYEAGGMSYVENYKESCDKLVNWSLFLNMLYCRCGISNSFPLCPVRFILPSSNKTLINNNFNTKFKFEIRDKSPLVDLFDGNPKLNAEFIGIIAIKYYHEETQQNRIWYLFIFNNNDITRYNRQNTITGIRDKIIICNYRLRQINMFGLFEKHNITHYELLHYISLSKNTPEEGKIYFYKSLVVPDDDNIFISRKHDLESNEFLSDLKLIRANLELENISGDYHKIPKTNIYLSYSMSKQLGGGENKLIIKIKKTLNESKLYFSDLVLSKYYTELLKSLEIVERLGWYTENENDNYISNDRKYIYKYLINTYPYILVDKNDSSIKYKGNKNINIDKDINIIPKYKPYSTDYFRVNEIFVKYNLFNILNKKDSILSVGTSLSFFEYIINKKYNFKLITNILTLQQNYYVNLINEWKEYINKISSIYNINNIKYDDSIYNIYNSHITSNIPKDNKIIFWSVSKIINGVIKYNSYYNIPVYISGILFSLQHLIKGGTLIFNIESVAYKHTADIILIIAQYFDTWNLFYSEIHNRYKRTGTTVIFYNFKSVNELDIQYLEDLLNKVKKIYQDECNSFNINNEELRNILHIARKPIPSKTSQNIIEFLNYDINDTIYEPFKTFNDSRYINQLLYVSQMIKILSNPERNKILNIKLPTQDQILSSILYCKKYDIPIFDKYSKNADNTITKTILSDMYGLHEPILYKFKTPFKTYIADKIVINPRISHISKSKSSSNHKSHSNTILKTIHSNKTKSNKSNKYNKITKNSKTDGSMGSFFRNLLDSSSKSYKSTKKTKKQAYKMSNMKISKKSKKSMFRRKNIPLEEAIFNSNNQLVQVGRLIDVRKDFSKANPTEIYDKLKDQLRFYKGTGKAGPHNRKVGNLDIKIQKMLGDLSISQAWLKMYEMLIDCDIVPTNRKGTYKSFHFCEAPGTFINCLNNYIHTKTQYDNYEWKSQSLDIKVAKVKDTYGLIKRHRPNWDFGVDDSGDITNIENIKHYAEMAKQINPSLITSDCGLEWGNPKYYHVAYASYVAILYSLPKDATMIYKILSPIDVPLIWNLIYITYTNFKDMYFYKPVQNSQSREFYIVAKVYLGTDQKVLDKLLSLVDRFNVASFDKESYDLFGDSYPEEFVIQVQTICERLASNYVNSIERIIYYVDNVDSLGKDYQKNIENYIEEKNEDWVKRYKPRKMDRKWIL